MIFVCLKMIQTCIGPIHLADTFPIRQKPFRMTATLYGLQMIHLSCGSDLSWLQRYLQMVDIPFQLAYTLHTANSFSCIMTNRPTFSEGRYFHELQRPFRMAWTFTEVRYIYELKRPLHMAWTNICQIPFHIGDAFVRVADAFSCVMHHFSC